MKISVAMAFNESTEPDFIKNAVQLVEAKGVHGLWVPEHVLFLSHFFLNFVNLYSKNYQL